MAFLANWTGVAMFAAGALLIWSALARRTRVRAAAARGEVAPPLHPSLVVMGDIMPPIITFGLIVAGVQVVLAYYATGGAGFTLVDVAGFLFLLVAYDLWVRFRTRYRPPVPAPAPRR